MTAIINQGYTINQSRITRLYSMSSFIQDNFFLTTEFENTPLTVTCLIYSGIVAL